MSERCQERSPATGLPCTRKAGHQSEPMGRLHMSSDARGWTDDPWTAPLHQAPDADGRIVGALADAGCPSCRHRPHYHRIGWCMFQDCDCTLSNHEALAPTVARLIEDAVAAERARTERAEAQVERVRGLADEWEVEGRFVPGLEFAPSIPKYVAAEVVRAALAETAGPEEAR